MSRTKRAFPRLSFPNKHQIRFSDEMWEFLQIKSRQDECTISSVIRRAVAKLRDHEHA